MPMSKPFDATTKELLASDPRGWLELLLGRRLKSVHVLNVDLSTITTEADSVLSVEAPEPWLVHVEFQSGYDSDLPLRLQRYNVLVNYRHRLPVQSVALLLCEDADGPVLTGLLQQKTPDGFIYHEFRYNVVRVWKLPASEILTGGLATLPLAPLANLKKEDLPGVIQAIHQRLEREATENQAQVLWAATYLLMGLTYPEEVIDHLLQGVQNMRESVTYQKILREGHAEGHAEGRAEGRAEGQAIGRTDEVRKVLKRLGTKRFGKSGPEIDSLIDRITDLDELEQLTDRVLDVQSWEELIGKGLNQGG
jgi:predicted transposase YdaD